MGFSPVSKEIKRIFPFSQQNSEKNLTFFYLEMLIFILIQEYADDVLFSPCASITESFEVGPFPGISGNFILIPYIQKIHFRL